MTREELHRIFESLNQEASTEGLTKRRAAQELALLQPGQAVRPSTSYQKYGLVDALKEVLRAFGSYSECWVVHRSQATQIVAA